MSANTKQQQKKIDMKLVGNRQSSVKPSSGRQRKASDKRVVGEKRLISARAAAKYLGLSISFLAQDRIYGSRSGRTLGPPWIIVGKRGIRYDLQDLDEFIDTHRVNKTGKASDVETKEA